MEDSSKLPERLRRFAGSDTSGNPLIKIAFPYHLSRIKGSRENGRLQTLPLIVSGGRPPFFWYIDNAQLGPTFASEVRWQPDGPGHVNATVIDSIGRTSVIEFWVE